VAIYEEEIVREPDATIVRCFEFLGVDKDYISQALNSRVNISREATVLARQAYRLRKMIRSLPPGMEKTIARLGRRAWGLLPKRGGGDRLTKDMRQQLISEFMPDIRNLEDLIDRDLTVWYGAADT
jgi:hypothetical protein